MQFVASSTGRFMYLETQHQQVGMRNAMPANAACHETWIQVLGSWNID
jgi:hypothetical protein